MDSCVGRFYTLVAPSAGTLTLYSPSPRNYVWIELRVPPSLRGNGCAAKIVKNAFALLPGRHYIDFDPAITSFAAIARARRWRERGPSRWFEHCISYVVQVRRIPAREFGSPCNLNSSSTCPRVTSFSSKRSLNECLRAIERDLTSSREIRIGNLRQRQHSSRAQGNS